MNDDSRPGRPRPDDDPPADHLTRTLRELPRVPASPTFTDRVLATIASDAGSKSVLTSAEHRSRTRTSRATLPALLAAAAAAAGALVLTFGAADPPPAPQSIGPATLGDPRDLQAIGAELDELRREQRDLAAEVASLRAQESNQPVPVIYVGQSAGVDLVLDLARFQERVRPAGPEGEP